MKYKLLLLPLTIVLILSLMITPAFASGGIDESVDTLNKYYKYSTSEDFEDYYSIISSMGYSEMEFIERQAATMSIWEAFDTISYSLSGIVVDIQDEVALLTYSVDSKVQDPNGQQISFTREMAAIMFWEETEWKIWQVMPRASFELKMSLVSMELDVKAEEEKLNYDEPGFFEKIGNFFSREVDQDIYGKKDAECGNTICEEGEGIYDCFVDCQNFELCDFDILKLNQLEDINLNDEKEIPKFMRKFVKDNLTIEIYFTDSELSWYVTIKDGVIDFLEPKISMDEFCYLGTCIESKSYVQIDSPKELDYIVSMTSCTYQQLVDEEIIIVDAYNLGLVDIKGGKLGSKVIVGFGGFLFKAYNWITGESKVDKKEVKEVEINPYQPIFTDDENNNNIPTITEINKTNKKNNSKTESAKDADEYFETFSVEHCELIVEGEYVFLGKSSRGPIELYMGTGGSTAKCNVNSKLDGEMYIYVKVADDGKHADGKRDVDFTINGKAIHYNHKSVNYVTETDYWGWEYLGTANINQGMNTIEIVKTRTTSAAFVMSEFSFRTEKIS